ncbi:MAG TPA: hypothetical protein VNU19_06950 [Candidatus Acidoferrum sp.]|jgi:hypothetical protein|nr:hypothetical protein [Candidatus Acidoferrum sp.]
MSDDYDNLMLTEEFAMSLNSTDPPLSEEDVTGVLAALDDLNAEPTNLRNRLHQLDRDLKNWWSLTPPEPADRALRILVKPERVGDRGIWRVGPVTWHYAR